MNEQYKVRALEELGCEFSQAAEREQRHRHRRGRGKWRARPLALVLALGLSGSAVAGTLLVTEGDPIPAASVREFSAEQRPLPATSRLAGVQTADPEGGLPWGLRLTEGRAGSECFTVGRIYNGKLGQAADSVFRELPDVGPQHCTTFTSDRPVSLNVKADQNGGQPRTVLYGLASQRIQEITLHVSGDTIALEPDRDGAFLAVMRDYPAYKIDVHYKDGQVDRLDPSRPSSTLAPTRVP